MLDPDLVIVDVNEAYLRAAGRSRQDLIGQHLFDAFPDDPADPDADDVQNLGPSLRRVLGSKKPEPQANPARCSRTSSTASASMSRCTVVGRILVSNIER
ncbi:PAS domain-containing protein [Streptomyces sp. NPDC088246]|uniref:PAS domain-containing protein n=1 Tax=Streptomyces sp. NPDC088246 TaxID=3365842 RepID=UPI0037FCA728